jgi:F-type H+-transporting ATPase subunit b
MMRTTKYWVGLIALLATVAPVLASGETGAAPNPFAGDLGVSIWTLVIFLVVVILLGKFLWGPILNGLQSREAFIAKSLTDAEQASKTAQAQLAEYTAKLDAARAEASNIVEEGRRDAEEVKRAIGEEARKEADAMIERAKREIGIARDAALRELYDVGGGLATQVAGKIVSRELNPADHEQLIQESIAELGKLDLRSN